jgi:nitroreductase
MSEAEQLEPSPLYPLRKILHKRRSALELDNSAYMEKKDFYAMLEKCLPEKNPIFNPLSFGSFTHLLLFVNRVKELVPGLYIFLRKPEVKKRFKAAIRPDFLWQKPENCPERLEFYLLMEETLHSFIAQLSCSQRKAADACFTACMLSEFEEPLNRFGSWIYPYLFWECGILGQLLYLEAEAYGLRGCGIGCFFDEPLHEAIGLKGLEFQDLYHFAVGYPLNEIGFVTLPAYED